MIFLIHAFETNYCGLHGIEDWAIDEAEDENDYSLDDYGRELSMRVIESYGFLEEEYIDEDTPEDEYDDIINEHLAWEIIPLPKAPSTEACWEYLQEHNDPEGLIEMYS